MGVTVNEAASTIANLLQPEQPSDSADEPETAEQPEIVEEESEVLEEADQEPEQEYDEAEETPEGDTEPEEPLYQVKVNGEDREVNIDDLRKGYMMEADYRKKTSDVARQRESVAQKEAALSEKLADAETMLRLELEDLNSEENIDLKEYDRKAYEDKKDALQAKAKRLDTLKQQQAEENNKRRSEDVGKELELTLTAIPEWLDNSVLEREGKMLNKLWDGLGFTPKEMEAFTNHKLILLSRKAALYDNLQAAKPEGKKVAIKPKAAKAGTVKTKEERSRNKDQDARNRLKKTGNVRDAANVIKNILG